MIEFKCNISFSKLYFLYFKISEVDKLAQKYIENSNSGVVGKYYR